MRLSLTVLSLLGTLPVLGAIPDVDSPLIDDVKLQNAGMFRYWQAHLPVVPGDSLEEAHLIDQALYVVTDGGTFFALAADTGLLRWGVKLTEADHRIYRPTHVRQSNGLGPIVIPTTTRVFVYNRFTGDLIQSFAPEFAAGSAAVAYDDKLFMGSSDGRFYSLKLRLRSGLTPLKRWEVLAGSPIETTPVLYDRDMLLFTSLGGAVFSCFAPDKTLNWAFRAGGPVTGDPAVDAGGVYVASLNRSLYKLHLGTGRMIWRARLPRPLDEGPVVAAHTVFQFCPSYGIVAFDPDTGEERWRRPDGRTFVAHHPRGDILATLDGRLLVVDNETGNVQYTIEAPAVVATVSNTVDDAVYLLGRDGRVLCARTDSVPYLRRQQIIAARRQLNLAPQEEVEAVKPAPASTPRGSATLAKDPLRSRRDVRP